MFSFRNQKQIKKTRIISDSLKKNARSILASKLRAHYTGVYATIGPRSPGPSNLSSLSQIT